ncbi:hypothetical protein SeLEV6574_g02713 [Synchytrium endobioticum]|uniref:Uncharacterized protein n=1 Tax=Synchytrium endobioticum TaxID=286115 RepID=A0A507D7V8_9FUNG|nr:hypothetical protein SeLEV6574_g02713 [Synchytrium endobioticum]
MGRPCHIQPEQLTADDDDVEADDEHVEERQALKLPIKIMNEYQFKEHWTANLFRPLQSVSSKVVQFDDDKYEGQKETTQVKGGTTLEQVVRYYIDLVCAPTVPLPTGMTSPTCSTVSDLFFFTLYLSAPAYSLLNHFPREFIKLQQAFPPFHANECAYQATDQSDLLRRQHNVFICAWDLALRVAPTLTEVQDKVKPLGINIGSYPMKRLVDAPCKECKIKVVISVIEKESKAVHEWVEALRHKLQRFDV